MVEAYVPFQLTSIPTVVLCGMYRPSHRHMMYCTPHAHVCFSALACIYANWWRGGPMVCSNNVFRHHCHGLTPGRQRWSRAEIGTRWCFEGCLTYR